MKLILKLGGSLMPKGRELMHFLGTYAEKKALSFVIIPGGGPFVEPIKKRSERMAISDDAAHWMAVLATHQYGFFLADGRFEIVENLEELSNAGPICILLPYNTLKADDCLPHTWDVTSDTIAAFITTKLGEKTFIKLTDVDGLLDEEGLLIERIHAKEMIEKEDKGCVDAELPGFLMRNNMSCVIVNGNFPERIIAVIEGKETVCTQLVSDSKN